MHREKSFNYLRTGVAGLIAVLTAFLIILLVSDNPSDSIYTFIVGPLTKPRYIGNVIELAVPMIFSGLAFSVLFQASLFNLGADGIYFASGAIVSWVAIFVPMPSIAHKVAIIVLGAIVGAGIMMIPAYLKTKFNASELVTSLMMNSILLGIGAYLLNVVMKDTTSGAQVSIRFLDTAKLPDLTIGGVTVHIGLIIALICVVLTYVFLYKTNTGYEIRLTGNNPKFAKYSGINTAKVIVITHLVAGILCGIGGSVETIGMYERFTWTALPGLGFDGALIAMLSRNNPASVVGSALFVAYLRIGADLVARLSDVPTEMVAVLQALIILLISAERFLHKYKQKWIQKESV